MRASRLKDGSISGIDIRRGRTNCDISFLSCVQRSFSRQVVLCVSVCAGSDGAAKRSPEHKELSVGASLRYTLRRSSSLVFSALNQLRQTDLSDEGQSSRLPVIHMSCFTPSCLTETCLRSRLRFVINLKSFQSLRVRWERTWTRSLLNIASAVLHRSIFKQWPHLCCRLTSASPGDSEQVIDYASTHGIQFAFPSV